MIDDSRDIPLPVYNLDHALTETMPVIASATLSRIGVLPSLIAAYNCIAFATQWCDTGDVSNKGATHLCRDIPNAETIAAMKEAEDIASGKIQAKSYFSFKDILDDALAEEAED